MKKYINTIKNIKGFSFVAFLFVMCVLCVVAYFGFQMYKEKAAGPKFQNYKEIVQKVANAVYTYNLIYSSYPNKASELNLDLDILSEKNDSQHLFIGFPNNIGCFIVKSSGDVSCNQQISGHQIALVANKKDSSFMCVTLTSNKNNFTNRLCKKAANNKKPLCGPNSCMYMLN